VTGPVLGFRPDGDALERFIEHNIRLFRDGCTAREEVTHA
jgi:hypothetical protein